MVKKPLKIFYSETNRLLIFKLGILHWGLEPYKDCSVDDPGLTLTFITARSNLLPDASV